MYCVWVPDQSGLLHGMAEVHGEGDTLKIIRNYFKLGSLRAGDEVVLRNSSRDIPQKILHP
jgi:hypothetical protein